ncbi:MAG TPA: sigma 54-interacting transcriptional regulator [Chitinophagaceae bacterium]|nr:sigma 54-interacting transcriptional regulator [Chitinophagaceae bacterium]
MSKTTNHASNKEKDLLRQISEATSGLMGKDLLEELCKNFTRALNMQYALVAECIEEGSTQVRTICFVNGDTVADNIEYDTSNRPCELILSGREIFEPKDVYKKFPASVGIEAATGVPIYSSVSGKVIGHIIVSSPRPVTEESNQTAILKIFASRIGAEIERMKAEKELRRQMKENEFYAFTLNNLKEAVFWVDEDAYIWEVNNGAAELSGYSKDELRKMRVFDINQSVQPANWPEVWNRLKEKKKVIFDAKFRHRDGTIVDIEIAQNFMVFDGREYTCSIVRDIRQRRFEEELLRTVSEATSGLTGEDFLIELAKHITMTLTMRYALITECVNDDKTRLRTLCYVDGEKVLDNIEYDTAGIPCEIIMQGKDFFMPQGVHLKFPKEEGIEATVGVPIYSTKTGDIIGHILVLDPKPVTTEKNQTSILKIFAARAGAEIERMKAEKELEKANAELKLRLNEIESLKNQLQLENKYLQEEIRLTYNFEEIISRSKDFQKILQQIQQVASTDATVLILGESGTGKELIARAVHNISNRSKRPLVKVNCATLPANLIESELFGHEKGAFTGAMERKIGRFELADGGSIFLDEIGELPVELQAKLLRVLQEGEFERLGNPKTMKVNVRVIAATNRNLQLAIEKKEFREDLYYRLNVFPIICPPLRDRKEDIPLLVKHFCQKHEGKIGRKITSIPVKVMDALMAYDWPGNIRELENIIERAMILSREGVLEYGEWVPAQHKMTGNNTAPAARLEDVEKTYIVDVLKRTGWKVSGEKGAAKILGLNPTTLEARMKKLGIKREA